MWRKGKRGEVSIPASLTYVASCSQEMPVGDGDWGKAAVFGLLSLDSGRQIPFSRTFLPHGFCLSRVT